MQKHNFTTPAQWATGIFLLTVALFVFPTDLSSLLNLATNETQLIPLALPADGAQVGGLIWSLDSRAFAATIADNLCSPHPKTTVVHVGVPDLAVTTLVTPNLLANSGEITLQTDAWSATPDNLTLVDQQGQRYKVQMAGTELMRLAPDVYVSDLERWKPVTDLDGATFEPGTTTTLSQPVAHPLPADICPPYDAERQVEYNCAELVESFQLAAGVPGVARAGARLTVATGQGTVLFTNQSTQDSREREFYHYVGYLPQLHHHLIRVNLYEWGQQLLVNADTGELTPIPVSQINESGTRLALAFSPSEMTQSIMTIQLWRLDLSAAPALQPERVITIPYPNLTHGETRAEWRGDDQFHVHFADRYYGLTDDIIVDIGETDVDIKVNGEPANRPALRVDMRLNFDDPIRAVDHVDIGKRLYADRDYIFTGVPEPLMGQPYFLFDNSNMHETTPDYATFHLYRPTTLAVAIDEQACALPGWLADWTPADVGITTNDIGMKLYQKTFPEGDVMLGGNEAPPAACIRSHYLLFVGEPEGDLP